MENSKEKQEKRSTMNGKKESLGKNTKNGNILGNTVLEKQGDSIKNTILSCFLQCSGSVRKETKEAKNQSKFFRIEETDITTSFCKLKSKGVTTCSANRRYQINNEDLRELFKHTGSC